MCWNGEKILVGTNASEIFEVAAGNKHQPITIVQVRAVSQQINVFLIISGGIEVN